MRIYITRHARGSMKKRGITEQMIEETLETPDDVKPGFGGRQLAEKVLDDRKLRVVFRREKEQLVVITAYFLEG